MTPTEGILNELTIQHEPGQVATDFNVSLPQSVDVCTIHVRISAGNSAGMSAPSEPVGKILADNYITERKSKTVKNSLFLVCSGGNTDSISTTTVSTASTVSTVTTTQSGSNGQPADNTTLIGEV